MKANPKVEYKQFHRGKKMIEVIFKHSTLYIFSRIYSDRKLQTTYEFTVTVGRPYWSC